jgi:hypothetical protein
MQRLEFIYSRPHDAVFCNNALLTKNLPARILAKLLHLHLNEGRAEFEYLEFKWDRGLFLNSKETHFETRLKRLVDLLTIRDLSFHYRKISRGRFGFRYGGEAECAFRFEEQDIWSFTSLSQAREVP